MALKFDFALEGFRTIRERPKLILFWGAVSLFGFGLGTLLLVAFSGPAFATAISIGNKPVEDSLRLDLLQRMMPGIGACLPVLFLTLAVINGAVCRAGLNGGDDLFGFLRFGLSEIRIFLVMTARFVLALVVLFVTTLVAQAGVEVVPAGAVGLQAAGLLAAAGGVLWLEVRLSLSIPQTFAMRRLDLFGSFALTRDHFWPLLRGYAGATGLMLCVAFLCGKIAMAILGFAFGDKAISAFPDVTSLHAYLTPQTITNDCLSNGLVMPLLLAILMGAPVAAYRALVPTAIREPA